MVPWYPVSLFTFIRGINWVKSQRRVLWQVVESATFEPIYLRLEEAWANIKHPPCKEVPLMNTIAKPQERNLS
jgi:hypothetical protein